MMNITKVVSSVIIIACLCLLQNLINSRKHRRIRQFPLVILSFCLLIAGIVVWFKNYDRLNLWIRGYSRTTDTALLVINGALMAAFIVVKIAVCPICSFLIKQKKVLDFFAFSFYLYDDSYGEYFLSKKWLNFRKYMFAIMSAFVVFCGGYLGLTWIWGSDDIIWMSLFPCAALIVFGEVYSYINGQTKEEYERSVLGKEADARRISSYYKLRGVLEEILPQPLLSSHAGCDFLEKETPADMIKQLKTSEMTEDQIVAEFFEIKGRYKTADIDCFQATVDMMHRRNVVFFNPFYKDLSVYITLPLVRTLLSGKKGIILCGRRNIADDVKEWITALLSDYSHMHYLWRVDVLSDRDPECEVGILTFPQIYDKRVINTNETFLRNADFVIMIEPSIMLNTSQIALSIIAELMNGGSEKPVYCVCDRYTDGLIDTMSHLIQSEITDVVAMPVPRCNYSAMNWDADGDFRRQSLFDKQTQYLGDGLELSAIAVKNQVPEATWYGETKSPIKDIKWIAGQYYPTICRYMNLPSQQKKLYEKINFVSTLWSAEKKKEQFLVAEDEFCNMYSMMRAYLSRGENQIFVNILSENYLLRDYMRCNGMMFLSNPNAIPSYVPDYAKTERNTIIKLILMMTLKPVREEEIYMEFHLAGIETDDVIFTLLELLEKYTYADETLFTVKTIRTYVDEFTTTTTSVYSVAPEDFDKHFANSLKNAYYILEDEKGEESYIDAKMYNHVTQTILPGQFVTYDGKYYQAKYVSPQSGVVLRRASNLYAGRKYYRQIRNYKLCFDEYAETVSHKVITDIDFSEIRTDFEVTTTGYLELRDNHDLRSARLIDFEEDPLVDGYTRKYKKKSVLKIKLPDADAKTCYTICLLLSEVFRSVFPNGWQYLAVVTKKPENIEGMLNYVVYPATGDVEEGYIYVIEDSDIDLGLLSSVEKNFLKIMQIVADFLDWHFEKMREPMSKDPIPVTIAKEEREAKKLRGGVVSLLDRVRRIFGRKQEEQVKIEAVSKIEEDIKKGQKSGTGLTPATENHAEEKREKEYELGGSSDGEESGAAALAGAEAYGDEPDYELGQEKDSKDKINLNSDSRAIPVNINGEMPKLDKEDPLLNDPELTYNDGLDIFDESSRAEIDYRVEEQLNALFPVEKTRYQRECYLKFGYDEIDGRLHIDDLWRYLRVRGYCNNDFTLARKRNILKKSATDIKAENCCDFCGLPMTGVSYDRLNDGRVRCNDCSSSAISTVEEFRNLFYQCLGIMEDFYDIQFRISIKAKMTDAHEIARGWGMIHKPGSIKTGRVLGYARKQFGNYGIIVENGSPRLATIETVVHELTHLWQYKNWKDKEAIQLFGMYEGKCTQKALDILYEGMAVWASIQYLYQIGETYFASRKEEEAEVRQDIYGMGFRLYREQFPLVKDTSLLKATPFVSFPPIDPEKVKNAVKGSCSEKDCMC